MPDIRNLTRNGETFYPLTTMSAVINESTGEGMTVDSVPTSGSDNLVKSGGVYNEVTQVTDQVSFNENQKLKLYLATLNSSGNFAPAPVGSTSYTRAACRDYIKAPFQIKASSGFQVFYMYKYALNNDGTYTVVEGTEINTADIVCITDENYLYRLNFRKPSNVSILDTELGNIVSTFENLNTSLTRKNVTELKTGKILEKSNISLPYNSTMSELAYGIYLIKDTKYLLNASIDSAMSGGQFNLWLRHIDNSHADATLSFTTGLKNNSIGFTAPVTGLYYISYRSISSHSNKTLEISISTDDSLSSLENSIGSVFGGEPILSMTNISLPYNATITGITPGFPLIKGTAYRWHITLNEKMEGGQINLWLRHTTYAGTADYAVYFTVGEKEEVCEFIAPYTGLYFINYRSISSHTTKTITSMVIESYSIKNIREDISSTTSAANILRFNPYYWHYQFQDWSTVLTNKIIAPAQSLFDIQIAARLGFSFIELNVHETSDGKFVCFHGNSGNFDAQFELSSNPTGLFSSTADFKTINCSQVSLSDIKNSLRYRAKYEKYRTSMYTLEECLYECKRVGIAPLVTFNKDTCPIIESIVGKNYIGYIGGPSMISTGVRGLTSAMLVVFDNTTDSAQTVYDYCDALGGSVLYCAAKIDSWSDELVTDYVDTMHKRGYYVAGIPFDRNEASNQKYLNHGYDGLCSKWNINKINVGNICNLSADVDFSEFTHNGTVSNGVLTLSNGNTLSPNFQIPSVFLGGAYLEIIFNGTITISMGEYINLSVTSSGEKATTFSSAFFESIPTFTITSSGSTIINGIQFKASKF